MLFRSSNVIRQPTEELILMTAPWPFAQWGLDIIGPFPIVMWQLKFLIVAIDNFTKWVEAEALATIMEKNVRSFVWKNIVYRYEIPRVLVSDNGKQFYNDSLSLLLTVGNQESLLLPRPPSSQWAG